MQDAKFFVGAKVKSPLGIGTVSMLRFSSKKGGRYYVVGSGWEQYFRFEEIELLEPIIPAKEQPAPKKVQFRTPCPKVHFHSYKLAQDRLKTIMLRSNRKNKPVRAYRCDKCGLWHLTSKPIKMPPIPT